MKHSYFLCALRHIKCLGYVLSIASFQMSWFRDGLPAGIFLRGLKF